jgi:hypothetical protein
MQYIVESGTSGSTALDGSPRIEIDGNWVSIAYEFFKQGNSLPQNNSTLIGAKRIAFNCSTGELDSDFDKVYNSADNCPSNANADQSDIDGDTQGDVCDTDDDGDGVADASDNCPSVVNADQADADDDTQGDVCDSSPNPEEPTPVPVEGDGGDEQDDETDDNETDDNETDDNETVEEPLNTTDDESETSENSGSDEQTSEGSEGNNDSSGTRSSDSDVSEDDDNAASKTDSRNTTINTRKEIDPKSSDGGPSTVLIIILVVLGVALLFALGFFANKRKSDEETADVDAADQKMEDSNPTNGDKDFND